MKLKVDIRGNGYPILCLHGHPGSKECHEVFTDSLAQYWQTIAPDLRGYGDSQTRHPFSMDTHLEDLTDLLDQLAIQDCLILGWSLGGILGLELALRFPKRIKGLILIASAAHPVSQHPPITWQDNIFTILASLINKVRPGWPWNIRQFGQRSLYRYLIQTHHPKTYGYLAQHAWPAFFATSKFANQALNQALRADYDQTQKLETLQIPTLVLAGECDRHITATASQHTAAHISGSTFICYPNTAHLFPWEIPVQVNQDISEWLSQYFGELRHR